MHKTTGTTQKRHIFKSIPLIRAFMITEVHAQCVCKYVNPSLNSAYFRESGPFSQDHLTSVSPRLNHNMCPTWKLSTYTHTTSLEIFVIMIDVFAWTNCGSTGNGKERAFVTLLCCYVLCSEDKRGFRPFLARAHLIYRQHYVHLLQQYCIVLKHQTSECLRIFFSSNSGWQ